MTENNNYCFLKVATTLVDILLIELKLHPSHVKQMYSQPVHLTRELILRKQFKRGRVDFRRDSPVKSLCWHQVSNL